jgi:hypothetical protein
VNTVPKVVRELEFKVLKEDWFIYKLKDGSILKIKPILIKVFETDQINPEKGEKVYGFEGTNVVVIKSPENLFHFSTPRNKLQLHY